VIFLPPFPVDVSFRLHEREDAQDHGTCEAPEDRSATMKLCGSAKKKESRACKKIGLGPGRLDGGHQKERRWPLCKTNLHLPPSLSLFEL
jgi:hypothetical protein